MSSGCAGGCIMRELASPKGFVTIAIARKERITKNCHITKCKTKKIGCGFQICLVGLLSLNEPREDGAVTGACEWARSFFCGRFCRGMTTLVSLDFWVQTSEKCASKRLSRQNAYFALIKPGAKCCPQGNGADRSSFHCFAERENINESHFRSLEVEKNCLCMIASLS
jgi:hypothetical protein